MSHHSRFLRQSIRGLAAVVLGLSAISNVRAQDATAPTASEDPAIIDQAWQKASSKYDSARAALLKEVDSANAQGPFRADWESLQKFEAPDWYRDAKFGIFIHWGAYSVPAFGNEWYPRNMYRSRICGIQAPHRDLRTAAEVRIQGLPSHVQSRTLRSGGLGPSYSSRLVRSTWFPWPNITMVLPCTTVASVTGPWSKWARIAIPPGNWPKRFAPKACISACRPTEWNTTSFSGWGARFSSDMNDPQYASFYGPAHTWVITLGGLLSATTSPMFHRHGPTIGWRGARSWSRNIIPISCTSTGGSGRLRSVPNLTRFAAFYYNSSLKYGDHVGVINYKDYAMKEHAGVLDLERGQLGDIRPLYWQTDTSISNKSWGYIQDDTFKSPQFVIHQLIDIVSKNGNLLLNIGPRSDGTIPDEIQRVLLDVGEWLNTNGEAIYGTRPWRTYGEGPTKVAAGSFHDTDTANYTPEDFRFTTKGDVLYAIGLAWPGTGEAVIHSLGLTLGGKRVQSVSLVGSETKVQFSQGPEDCRCFCRSSLPRNTLTRFA